MVKNGIDRIKVSCGSLGATAAFFRDTLEMTLVDEADLDPAACERLWRLPAGTRVRAAYLTNAEQSTLIELLEVSPNTGRPIREQARMYDHGLLDVAIRAKGLDAVHADLSGRGFEFVSKPVVYRADWANVTVAEVILIGPDRLPVALIERLTEPKPVITGRFGTMVDVAQYVASIDAALPFYTDLLGYSCVFNQDLPDGLIDEVVGLPPGSRSRLALLYQTTTKTPAVELIQCSAPGRSLAADIHPTRLGLFAMAFEVSDLAALARGVRELGFDVIAGPVEMAIGVRGRIEAVTVRGPNEVLLEFFSR